MLVLVCGIPGVGKTTVAEQVADRLDGELLRTDVVRKELFDDPEYTDEEARQVYDELLARGEQVATRGGVAVADGTFHDRRFRELALATAARAGVDCRFVRVECEAETARERIRARAGDASDADVSVHDMFRDTFEPLAVEHATIDNSGSLAATRRQVDDLLETLAPADAASTRREPVPTGEGD